MRLAISREEAGAPDALLLSSVLAAAPGDPSARAVGDPWVPPRDAEAHRRVLDLHDRLLPVLTARLNGAHGLSFSTRAWRIMLSPWLVRYAAVLLDRWTRVAAAAAQDPALRAAVADGGARRPPADTSAFYHGAFEDAGNIPLVARLLEAERVPVDRTPGAVPAPAAAPAPGPDGALTALAASLGARRRWPILVHSVHRPLALLAALAPRAYVLRTAGAAPPPPPHDPGLRAGLAEGFSPRDRFETVLAALLPADLPTAFVEGLPALLAASERLMPRPPEVLLSCDGWTYDEVFKACAARAADAGTRLVAVQHGGGYGQYARIWQEDCERGVCDSYWTWGWSSLDGDPRLKDVPFPLLPVPDRDPPAGEGLLLVGTYQPLWRTGFQSQPQGESFSGYLRCREEFLAALDAPALARTTVRLAAVHQGWNQRGRLSARWPGIALDDPSVPLAARLRRTALAVFDHPGTSWLESLALDRPTLLFWDPAAWPMRDSVRPAFDALRAAGVLHDDPRAAAAAASRTAGDPWAWWRGAPRREAVEGFRARFALSRADWPARWARALGDELSAARASR